MLFHTTAVAHLAKRIKGKIGRSTVTRFSDGEIVVTLKDKVKNKNVWVLASTQAPAENILELCLLLDVLIKEGAKVNLFLIYVGYARQDHSVKQESFSGRVVSKALGQFKLKQVMMLHRHSDHLNKFLPAADVIPLEIIAKKMVGTEVIVAPDQGAVPLAKKLSKLMDCPVAYLQKTRPRREKAKIVGIRGEVRGKKVMILDDMITTGGTIIEAARYVKRAGAKQINVYATHGLFTNGAKKIFATSSIKKIFVTNSFVQKKTKKVTVINIVPFIEQIIQERGS